MILVVMSFFALAFIWSSYSTSDYVFAKPKATRGNYIATILVTLQLSVAKPSIMIEVKKHIFGALYVIRQTRLATVVHAGYRHVQD